MTNLNKNSVDLCLSRFGVTRRFNNVLNDPDIWVANSGCTVHCTGFDYGMINVKKNDKGNRNTCLQLDGSENTIISTGDIPVVKHDQYGKEIGDCRLSGVNYVEGQPFNLFSTTKLLLAGWVPGGNTEALWFSRPDAEFVIKFDIKIETEHGCLFAANFRRRHGRDERMMRSHGRDERMMMVKLRNMMLRHPELGRDSKLTA
jgi:hypothetical protein